MANFGCFFGDVLAFFLCSFGRIGSLADVFVMILVCVLKCYAFLLGGRLGCIFLSFSDVIVFS